MILGKAKNGALGVSQDARGEAACLQAKAMKEKVMNVDKAIVRFAGIMILLSLALAQLVSPYWLLLTAFVGLNMLQASFTGFCPAAIMLKKLGVKPGVAFD